MRHLIIYAFAFMLTMPLTAQSSIYWAKKGNGFWHVANNWIVPGGTPQNRVPNAMDTVYIQHDSVIISSGVNAFARRIELGVVDSAGTGLAILDGGSLSINIVNSDTSNDSGIKITRASLLNIGNLQIKNSNYGIEEIAEAYIENRGMMTIDSCSPSAISMDGELRNTSTGYIQVDFIPNENGIFSRGIVAGKITNDGHFEMTNITGYAISCDEIINESYISVVASGGGIISGKCENFKKVEVWDCASGISSDTILNNDSIIIDGISQGLICDVFKNYGYLLIHDIFIQGINVSESLLNENGGECLLSNSTNYSCEGLYNEGILDNYGVIRVDSFLLLEDVGITNHGTINNYQDIEMTSLTLGLLNQASLVNIGGTLQIYECAAGISNNVSLINDSGGLIDVSASNTGYSTSTSSSNENRVGCTMTIQGGTVPFSINGASTFENFGLLEINN